MRVSKDYRVQYFLDSSIIIPAGIQVWNEKALIITNETGIFIWEKLAEGIQYDSLLREFKRYFKWNEKDACKRINDFLSLLRKRQLLLDEND